VHRPPRGYAAGGQRCFAKDLEDAVCVLFAVVRCVVDQDVFDDLLAPRDDERLPDGRREREYPAGFLEHLLLISVISISY